MIFYPLVADLCNITTRVLNQSLLIYMSMPVILVIILFFDMYHVNLTNQTYLIIATKDLIKKRYIRFIVTNLIDI